ncbi:MAG TPA: PEP-CTERM sorting domain-containing protein, partial [Fimbriimonadaceae bacterium]|nr:PEP-CTERM sorting domain-containing protein [Fimbriimonadaceae bacterium]
NATTGNIDNWFVSGIDNVFQHTYMLRSGDSGTATAMGAMTLDSATQALPNFLELIYSDSTFSIQVRYLLTGGTSAADLAESVKVTNISDSTVNARVFQYSDWDMNNTPLNDTVVRTNSSSMQQTDGIVSGITSVHGGTPVPDFSQLGLFANILGNITSTNGYFLDTAAGDGIGQSFSGDAAYAFQWNRTLAAGESFNFSTDKVSSVPEPASLFALTLGALALIRKRKKAA